MTATTRPTDDIWRALSTDRMGFYTSLTAQNIPEAAGVYGWFLPLRLGTSPDHLLGLVRQIFSYDAPSKSAGIRIVPDAGFNWDPLSVTIARDVTVKPSGIRKKSWDKVSEAGEDAQSAVKMAMLVGSIFAPPLYIGLTKNLRRRYHEHADGESMSNVFNKRLSDYVQSLLAAGKIQQKLTVRQLLFACIPITPLMTQSVPLTEDQIALVESLLKEICSPVFAER